jgi:hypothetical protein
MADRRQVGNADIKICKIMNGIITAVYIKTAVARYRQASVAVYAVAV